MTRAVIFIIWIPVMLIVSQVFALFGTSIAGAAFTTSVIGVILLVILLGIHGMITRAIQAINHSDVEHEN